MITVAEPVSDWAAIDQLPGDYVSDVESSINAGIDMVMVPNNYAEFVNALKSLVDQNKVSIDRINDAVKRILRVKFELGLFEKPLADRSLLSLVGSSDHRDVARQCVRESVVLLKMNDDILPIPKSDSKILVAGEHADNIGLQCGGWSIQWQGASGEITEGTTILEGFKKVAPGNEFIYDAEGNFDEALAYVDGMLDLYPSRIDLFTKRGDILQFLGDIEQAQAFLAAYGGQIESFNTALDVARAGTVETGE